MVAMRSPLTMKTGAMDKGGHLACWRVFFWFRERGESNPCGAKMLPINSMGGTGRANRRRTALIILLFLTVVFAGACGDSFGGARRQMDAIRTLKLIHEAEDHYHRAHGHYASLAALGPTEAGLVAEDVAYGRSVGCAFRIELPEAGYTIVASPLTDIRNATWSLYSDESGVVRFSGSPVQDSAHSQRIDGVSDSTGGR
jgi:hypothetical protein